MSSRRSLRLVAGALVLAVPVLSSCGVRGFDRATDKPYTPAAQTNDRSGEDVDVLAASVVAAQDNSGTFVATLASKTLDDVSFDSIEGAGDDSDLVFGPVDPPVDLPPRGHVNLATDGGEGITVQGDFSAGDFLDVTLTYSTGETSTLKVPVLYACEWWEGLDSSVSEEATEAPTTDPSASASPSASPAADVPEPGEPYDCAQALEEEPTE